MYARNGVKWQYQLHHVGYIDLTCYNKNNRLSMDDLYLNGKCQIVYFKRFVNTRLRFCEP